MVIRIFLCGITADQAKETSPQLFALLDRIVNYAFVKWGGTVSELVRMEGREPFLVHLPITRMTETQMKVLCTYCVRSRSVIFAHDEWVTIDDPTRFLETKALLQEVEALLRRLGTAISIADPASRDRIAIHIVPKVWDGFTKRATCDGQSIKELIETLFANAIEPLAHMGKPGKIQGTIIVQCGYNRAHILNRPLGRDDTPLRVVTEARWRHFDEYGYVCPQCATTIMSLH